ncbi:hypothetical protein ASE08_09930 [Rhizobacter sp. Root16D2]|nr:hypothetical protein ASC88_13645 [Rhizobacter sp. Root29]KQW09696.1 hypothetical protein ASC98_23655 [Rhizobacter sp. Root1238]KRB14725.1 hypothetical protein ASE08_09930 [Rhizobacter sp. Root16D2]
MEIKIPGGRIVARRCVQAFERQDSIESRYFDVCNSIHCVTIVVQIMLFQKGDQSVPQNDFI